MSFDGERNLKTLFVNDHFEKLLLSNYDKTSLILKVYIRTMIAFLSFQMACIYLKEQKILHSTKS